MATLKKRVSMEQLELLADLLENDPQLARGFSRTAEGRSSSSKKWENVANKLNAIGDGCFKLPKEWNKYWNDYKARIKAKNSLLKKSHFTTGGGPPPSVEMSNFEERILKLLGEDLGIGSPGVSVDPFPTEDLGDHLITEDILTHHTPTPDIFFVDESPTMVINLGQPVLPPAPEQPVLPPAPEQPVLPPAPEQPVLPPPATANRSRQRKRSRPQTSLDESRIILSQIEEKRVKAETVMAESVAAISRLLGPLLATQERIAVAAEETAKTTKFMFAQMQQIVESQARRAAAEERTAAAHERVAAVKEQQFLKK